MIVKARAKQHSLAVKIRDVNTRVLILITGILIVSLNASGQSKKDIEAFASAPKNLQTFPVGYCIALPHISPQEWDKGYEAYRKYLTPAIRKMECGMSYEVQGVTTWFCTASPMPHAQLDTATIIRSEEDLQGVWRVVSHKVNRYEDSMSYLSNEVYRSDTVLSDASNEDGFAIFKDQHFRLFAEVKGRKGFKSIISAAYELASGRYLVLYKYLKTASGISQIGIDKEGRLISHYASVIERKMPGRYIVYTSVIEQIIFEKIR